jgi:hypothetical protein
MRIKRLTATLLLFLATELPAPAQCPQMCPPPQRTLSVAANGTATADADLAIVHVGYRVFGTDAKDAYATASDTSNSIMHALTAASIPKNDIESTTQVLQRVSGGELQQWLPTLTPQQTASRQFTVVQGWTVRTKPDDAARVLNIAINAGANESGWVQWTMNDPNRLKAQASADALVSAHSAAELMAQRSGVHLGPLQSANQGDAPYVSVQNGPPGVGAGIGAGMAGAVSGTTAPLALSSRRVEVVVSVMATYSIEDAAPNPRP